MNRITRREALAAGGVSLTGAAASCRLWVPAKPSLVSIIRAPAYGSDLYDKVRRLLVDHKVDVKDKRVVRNPIWSSLIPATVINTHPMVVHAALEAFRALGAREVRIAEGPGHRRITLDLADAAGYFSTIPKFEDLFTDLNLDDVTGVHVPHAASKLRSVYLPNTALGCDLLVSLPKMKTHHWVGATLSMKNFFGLVPGAVYGWPKNVLHWAGIPECIADLHKIVPKTFAIVDGIVGMQGNGPIQGTPKHVGVLVAGSDLPAVDATCCRIMRIDPHGIEYLELAAKMSGST